MKISKVEKRRISHEIRATGDGNTLTGYIAVFNTPGEEMFGYVEQIAPGAFTDSLSNGSDIVCRINHDDNAPAGRLSNGTLRLEQDNVGLRFEVDLPATTRASDLKVSIERKDVSGCSFGFVCRDDQRIYNDDGSVLRILKDVELVEVSVGVTFPAYTATDSHIRSIVDALPLEIRSRLESRDTKVDDTVTDDTWQKDFDLRLRLAEAE